MDTKSGIPLDKRLLKGRVSSIDAGALHLLLPDAFRYADRARVSIEDLPKGRTLDSYRRLNDSLPVFLLAPSAKDPRLWYASIRWAESEEANPWFARPVSLKDTVHGTAKNYVENYAVIVRLDNGMDAFLHINELPAGHNHGSIADHVHIGDRIGGLVERIDERRLQINISIPPLLKRKREEEEQRREQLPFPDEDQPEAVTYTEPPLPSLPSDTYVLIIDNDRFFALAVKDWLEANGVKVNYTSKPQAVKTHLQQGRITHVLLDYHLDDTKSEKEIQNALKGKELRVAIASGDWKAAQKDAAKHRWAFLPKPLNSALLHCWLSGNPLPAEPLPADDQKSSLLWRGTRQEQGVLEQVNRFLAKRCVETACLGALWVKRERLGIFSIRAFHGLDEEALQSLQQRMHQTFLNAAIEENQEIVKDIYQSGPLENVAPKDTRHIWVFPLAVNGSRKERWHSSASKHLMKSVKTPSANSVRTWNIW